VKADKTNVRLGGCVDRRRLKEVLTNRCALRPREMAADGKLIGLKSTDLPTRSTRVEPALSRKVLTSLAERFNNM